jgi:hypothetical protein
LGGVGYAAATGSIDTREIRNNTVRSSDIRNSTILGRDVRNNTLGGVDIRESRLGTVPSGNISKLTYKSATFAVPGPGVSTHGQVSCDSGQFVTGGGVKGTVGAQQHLVQGSYPVGNNAWAADVYQFSGGGASNATVYAICAPAKSTG